MTRKRTTKQAQDLEAPHVLFLDCARFSAAVTFDEQAATSLIDAGIPKIHILSIEIASWVVGATPEIVVPTDCLGPTLVGFTARFPVGAPR